MFHNERTVTQEATKFPPCTALSLGSHATAVSIGLMNQSLRLREPEELPLLRLVELLPLRLTEPLLRVVELLRLTEPLLRVVELLRLTEPLLRVVELLLLTVPLLLSVDDVRRTVVPVERVVEVPLLDRTVGVVERVLRVTVDPRLTVLVPERVTERVAAVLLTVVPREASLTTSAERVAVTAPVPLVVRTLEGDTPVILR